MPSWKVVTKCQAKIAPWSCWFDSCLRKIGPLIEEKSGRYVQLVWCRQTHGMVGCFLWFPHLFPTLWYYYKMQWDTGCPKSQGGTGITKVKTPKHLHCSARSQRTFDVMYDNLHIIILCYGGQFNLSCSVPCETCGVNTKWWNLLAWHKVTTGIWFGYAWTCVPSRSSNSFQWLSTHTIQLQSWLAIRGMHSKWLYMYTKPSLQINIHVVALHWIVLKLTFNYMYRVVALAAVQVILTPNNLGVHTHPVSTVCLVQHSHTIP
jgi:hypothetical protein